MHMDHVGAVMDLDYSPTGEYVIHTSAHNTYYVLWAEVRGTGVVRFRPKGIGVNFCNLSVRPSLKVFVRPSARPSVRPSILETFTGV